MLYSHSIGHMYEVILYNSNTVVPQIGSLYELWWPEVYDDQPGPPMVSWMLMHVETRRVDFAWLYIAFVPVR